MKILFHFTITLFVLNLVACNQTKSPEPIKQYTFIGGKEGDKIDTTSFDSLQLSDPFILADEETQMYYLVGSGGSLWKSTNMKKVDRPLSIHYCGYNFLDWNRAKNMGSGAP